MNVLGIQNCEVEGFGRFEKLFPEKGALFTVVHPYRGEKFPTLHDFDVVVVGGTPVSALAVADHPFLQAESRFLDLAIGEAIPCLGICFGAQILAQLLGAAVKRAPSAEIGTYEVRLTSPGSRDPLLARFPGRFPVFHWHADTFSIPEGGDQLVTGSTCPTQMFRHGSVVGMQFHLEVTPSEARAWAAEYQDELAAFGKTESSLMEELAPHVHRMAHLSDLIATNLLNTIT